MDNLILRRFRAYGIVVAVYIGMLVLWQFANGLFRIPAFVLPTPSAIVEALVKHRASLAGNFATTLEEVIAGFLIGVLVSLPMGAAIVRWRAIDRLVYPFLVAFQSVPKVALAPILVVWFGFGPTSKVMLGFVTAMFPIVINTVIGLRQTPPELILLMRSLGASPVQTFLKIRAFAAAPYIFGGLKVGITLAVVGAVVGEFIAANSGLGYMLLTANNAFDTPLVFGLVVVLSLMSVALFYALEVVEVLVLPRAARRKGDEMDAALAPQGAAPAAARRRGRYAVEQPARERANE